MILKKLWFSVFCFLIHYSIAAEDISTKTDVLKMMPRSKQLNFIDNVLWTCTVQQLLAIEIQLSKDTEPSDDEFKTFNNQVLQLWRTLDIEVYRKSFDGYVALYNEIKNKEPKEKRIALTDILGTLTRSCPTDGITHELNKLYASSKDNAFDDKMLSYEATCTKILKVFTPDNLVAWINSTLLGINEIDYNNASLKLAQYRMISNVITPSGINEKTQIEDTQTDENVFATHVCQLFSQYLKDTVRVYKDFFTAVKDIDVTTIVDDEDKTSYMAGVIQEFTEIMYLVDSFKSLPVECLGDDTLNNVAGEVWRINDQLKAYFENFLGEFDSEENSEQKQIIEENGVLKYFLRGKVTESKEYLEESRKKLPTVYPEDSRKVDYETYYIDDKVFAYGELDLGVQNYPQQFTEDIKKIIVLRSVISFYTRSLWESTYKSTRVAQYSDVKNVLKCVVPDYLS